MNYFNCILPSILSAAILCVGCSITGPALAGADSDNDEKAAKPKQVKIGGIQWYVDYDAALKIAKAKQKPIWLHFGENPG